MLFKDIKGQYHKYHRICYAAPPSLFNLSKLNIFLTNKKGKVSAKFCLFCPAMVLPY